MSTIYVAVPGTWGEDDSWWLPGSLWSTWMATQGWFPADPEEPFLWSGDLDGVLLDRLTGRQHRDWIAAGAALHYYLDALPYESRTVIAHSHGGQAVAYCAAGVESLPPLPIRRAITVCTPTRDDMRPIWERAVPHIGQHFHFWAPGWKNKMQFLGQCFDGKLGFPAELPTAHRNLRLPTAAGHSGILTIPEYFGFWEPILQGDLG